MKITKYLFLLFAAVLSGCYHYEEPAEVVPSNFSSEYFNASNDSKMQEMINNSIYQSGVNDRVIQTAIGEVDLDNAIKVEDFRSGVIRYTFQFSGIENSFKNLVIKVDLDGNVSGYILTYYPDEQWVARNVGNDIDYSTYSGRLSLSTLMGYERMRIDFTKGKGTLFEVVDQETEYGRTECDGTSNGSGSGGDGSDSSGWGSGAPVGFGEFTWSPISSGGDAPEDDHGGVWIIIIHDLVDPCAPMTSACPGSARVLCDSEPNPEGGCVDDTCPPNDPIGTFPPDFNVCEVNSCLSASCPDYDTETCESCHIIDENGECVTINLNLDDQGYKNLTSCEKELFHQYTDMIYRLAEHRDLAHQKTMEIFGPYLGGNGHNDCGDAFRHAFFNALNTQRWGPDLAKKWGDAHECDTPANEVKEKDMDLYNNEIGRNVAIQAPNVTPDTLAEMILVEMESGSMRYLSPLDPMNNLLPNSFLISTSNCF